MIASDPTLDGGAVPEGSGPGTPEAGAAAPEAAEAPVRHGEPDSSRANPYLVDTSPAPAASHPPQVEQLDTAECWRLLEKADLGRLAVEGHDGRPDVFPVNYLVRNGNIFIRSAPGAKLRAITKHPQVAFEIDGETSNFHWSVVIRGAARRLDADEEIEASGILELVSSSPTAKDNFIRLMPDTVTGRRFPKRRRPGRTTVPLTTASHDDPGSRRDLKPDPIPHFSPLPDD